MVKPVLEVFLMQPIMSLKDFINIIFYLIEKLMEDKRLTLYQSSISEELFRVCC